jgi:Arc/MetJ-type ribon-helix-helix transcriptional regulator
MTIHLSKELESNILAVVKSGRYASVDDAMAAAASLLLECVKEEQAQAKPPAAAQHPSAGAQRAFWARIVDRSAAIPDEEWAKLPVDGAEQHDHYIYGTRKRQPAP